MWEEKGRFEMGIELALNLVGDHQVALITYLTYRTTLHTVWYTYSCPVYGRIENSGPVDRCTRILEYQGFQQVIVSDAGSAVLFTGQTIACVTRRTGVDLPETGSPIIKPPYKTV